MGASQSATVPSARNTFSGVNGIGHDAYADGRRSDRRTEIGDPFGSEGPWAVFILDHAGGERFGDVAHQRQPVLKRIRVEELPVLVVQLLRQGSADPDDHTAL